MVTEIGSSKEETILPNPKPALGKPVLNKMGGKMVPNNDKINPYFQIIEKSNGLI